MQFWSKYGTKEGALASVWLLRGNLSVFWKNEEEFHASKILSQTCASMKHRIEALMCHIYLLINFSSPLCLCSWWIRVQESTQVLRRHRLVVRRWVAESEEKLSEFQCRKCSGSRQKRRKFGCLAIQIAVFQWLLKVFVIFWADIFSEVKLTTSSLLVLEVLTMWIRWIWYHKDGNICCDWVGCG